MKNYLITISSESGIETITVQSTSLAEAVLDSVDYEGRIVSATEESLTLVEVS